MRTRAGASGGSETDCVRLNVAGIEIVVEPREEEVHGPIAEIFRLFDACLHRKAANRRVIVGLAGAPGSGKSTLAALFSWFSTRMDPPLPAVAVSIDGWHWSNEQLDAMTIEGPGGEPVSMRARKGSPRSFDVEGIVRAMEALRDAHMPLRVPGYDRRIHEVVPDAIIVPPGVRLVLLEGNYVLAREEPWNRVADRLDLGLYIEADPVRCREAVINRHVLGGLSRAEAIARYEQNDRLNAEFAAASAQHADAVIHVNMEHQLTRVQILSDRATSRPPVPRGHLPSIRHRDPFR